MIKFASKDKSPKTAPDKATSAAVSPVLVEKFAGVDSEGTYSTMMTQGDSLGAEAVLNALDTFGDEPQAGRPDGPLPWRSSLKLRKRTSDVVNANLGVDAGFVMLEPGKLACAIKLRPAAPNILKELDIYINGRLVKEHDIPTGANKTDPFYQDHFVLDVPADAEYPLEVEACMVNRILAAASVAAPLPASDTDVDGAFVDIRRDQLVFWASDRNDRARNVPLTVSLNDELSARLAYNKASFSQADIKEARQTVSDVTSDRDIKVVLSNAVTGAPLRRGRFLLRRNDQSYVIWNMHRTPKGELFVTALGFDEAGVKPVNVQVLAGSKKTAPQLVEEQDLKAFSFLKGHNSTTITPDQIDLSGDLKLRFALSDGRAMTSDGFALDTLTEVTR